MVNRSNKNEMNDVKTILDNGRILWVSTKHIEEKLDHKNVRQITIKYLSDHRNINMS